MSQLDTQLLAIETKLGSIKKKNVKLKREWGELKKEVTGTDNEVGHLKMVLPCKKILLI